MPAQGEKRTLFTTTTGRTEKRHKKDVSVRSEGDRWERRRKKKEEREGIHVGNRVDALALSDEPVFAFELDLEHVVQPAGLVLMTLNGLLRADNISSDCQRVGFGMERGGKIQRRKGGRQT
jgi:hypothetical protein